MTVGELIEILKTLDPALPVAVHANNHTYMSGVDAMSHGPLRVCKLYTYGGNHVVIGNVSKLNIAMPNWFATDVLDGGKDIPAEWPRY